MKKAAIALLAASVLLTSATAASAAPVDGHHKTHHKTHMKAKAAHKHKVHAKSASKVKKLETKKAKTPKKLPKTGYGGISE
ncbi:hypothetical protein [Cohnella soli]|uniref:Acid-shock protein n=1 Tax=Cohnella soli TaxID=425005 RepID=A0ABW0HRF5_9BACL